ncbi:MAG TPA: PAC2 family protein [Thermoplasmata archaeon]
MVQIEFRTFKEIDLPGGTVIEAIPSVGLVSTIAATYLITNLKVDQIVALDSEDFPPISMVYAYKPKFPVRIYAHPQSKLTIFIAEVPLPARVHRALALALLNWARTHRCRQIVALEGFPMPVDEAVNPVGVWGVGSTDRARKSLEEAGIPQLETGVISGVAGVILNEARWQEYDAISLLAEARPNIPDAYAAARILEAVDQLLPEIKIDLEPLKEQAKALEAQLSKLRRAAKPAIAEPAAEMFR